MMIIAIGFGTAMLVIFGTIIYGNLKEMNAFMSPIGSKKSAKKIEFRFMPYYIARMNERK